MKLGRLVLFWIFIYGRILMTVSYSSCFTGFGMLIKKKRGGGEGG